MQNSIFSMSNVACKVVCNLVVESNHFQIQVHVCKCHCLSVHSSVCIDSQLVSCVCFLNISHALSRSLTVFIALHSIPQCPHTVHVINIILNASYVCSFPPFQCAFSICWSMYCMNRWQALAAAHFSVQFKCSLFSSECVWLRRLSRPANPVSLCIVCSIEFTVPLPCSTFLLHLILSKWAHCAVCFYSLYVHSGIYNVAKWLLALSRTL